MVRFRLTASFFLCAQKETKSQRLSPLGGIYQKPFLLCAPKETVGKAVPAFRGKVSPCGEFLPDLSERNQRAKGSAFGDAIFPTPFLLTAPKETVSDRQRKALTGPSVRSSIGRRTKSGHTKRRFSLPLIPTEAAPSAAHGRAPGQATLAAGVSRGPGRLPRLPGER